MLLFAASCLLWLGVALTASRDIAGGLLPLMNWEIAWLAPEYTLTNLRLARIGLEDTILAEFSTRSPRIVGARYMPAGIPIESSTLAGHLLQPLVMMLSLVTTACLLRRRRTAAMVLLSIPAALVLVTADVPFVLVGALEDVVLSTQTALPVHSPWVTWMNFLNSGGRPALGIGAALAVISLARAMPAHTIRLAHPRPLTS